MKKVIMIAGLLLLVGALVLASCSAASKQEGPSIRPTPTPTPAPTPAPMPPKGIVMPDEGGGFALPSVGQDRMIVRNGSLSLTVRDVIDVRDRIAQMALRMNGFVVSSSISGEGRDMRGNVSIRIPDDQFEPALVELRGLAVRVESENTNSQDVTEQYIDLQGRLKNAEATENQYLALLNKATNVEETLKIYDSLSRVRLEIEQIKGQMQFLERTTSMSLISVFLRPVASAQPLTPVGWSPLETLKAAIRGLTNFGKWLANVAIWLVIFLPIWGTALGVTLWLIRRRKARPTQQV